MGLWVPSLIYPLFPPFIVDVGHNHSHLITQQSHLVGKGLIVIIVEFYNSYERIRLSWGIFSTKRYHLL